MTDGRKDVGIYLWQNMFMVDALVPHQILGLMPELNVYTFARTTDPITSDTGMKLIADYDLESVPQPDILIVGGGANPLSEMADETVIGALRKLAESAELVTSVCDGALILAQRGCSTATGRPPTGPTPTCSVNTPGWRFAPTSGL